MSRGLQNCNPGNIRQSKVRYKGEVRPSRDPAFKQFESLAWGYRAIFVLLDTYRIRYGLDTIRGMISRWAPPSETTPKPTSAPWPTPSESRTGNRSTPATARRCYAWLRLYRVWKTAPRPIWARWNWGGNCSSATSPHPADRPAGDERKQ